MKSQMMTHKGVVTRTNSPTAYRHLRETTKCWITKSGDRFLKTTGKQPGHGELNRKFTFALLVETVVPLEHA